MLIQDSVHEGPPPPQKKNLIILSEEDLKDRSGYSHLEEEALDRTMWRNYFGGGFGPVVRQNTE